MADLPDLARRYCLQNAIEHEGTCQPKSLMGRIMGQHPEFREDPGVVMQALVAAGEEVNSMSLAKQREALAADAPELLGKKKQERREGLRPLPGVGDGVVLRFAPNPNGPLSLGHSRGVAIMAEYARMHGGDLVLRFDDTDPQVKPPLVDPVRGWNGYDMIRDDFAWLAGRQPTREVIASDRIGLYQEHARRLIDAGGAYVCTCKTEAWRGMKSRGEPCRCRGLETSTVRERFDGMVAGEYEAGTAVLRVKTDIQHKDPALRDWVAFRVVAAVHPRAAAGEIPDHRAWPLLDFQSAVEDHLQGVTHVIRGKDLMDSTRKQAFLYQHMGWEYPETLYWGRVSIHEFGKFSTSWMRRRIEAGDFSGWDDPRLPTLAAVRRRGFRADALRAFWVDLGLTEKDVAVSMQNIEAQNGKLLDASSPRFFFVPDPKRLSLGGVDGLVARPLLHPPDAGRGRRELLPGEAVFVPGGEAALGRLRLKDLGNVALRGDEASFVGTEMDRSMPIVQWLPAAEPHPFRVLKPGTVDDIPDDAPEDAAPPMHTIEGVVEKAALEHIGGVVQFERFGFVTIEDETTGIWLHT